MADVKIRTSLCLTRFRKLPGKKRARFLGIPPLI
jgi:hypothetical protein